MVKTISFPNAARKEKDDRSEEIYFTWIFNEIRDSNNRMREAFPIHRRDKNLSPHLIRQIRNVKSEKMRTFAAAKRKRPDRFIERRYPFTFTFQAA